MRSMFVTILLALGFLSMASSSSEKTETTITTEHQHTVTMEDALPSISESRSAMEPLTVKVPQHAGDVDVTATDIIESPHSATTKWTPTVPGEYTFKVTVTDGCSSFVDTVAYDVTCNDPPIAEAGECQKLTKNCASNPTVYLDGIASRTAGPSSYFWSFCLLPEESSLTQEDIVPSSDDVQAASFVPDVIGNYCLQLRVQDCCGEAIDTVVIEYNCNSAPIANAGGSLHDYTFFKNEKVVINGSRSIDVEDSDILQYKWELISSPHNSFLGNDDISSVDITDATFQPDEPGEYSIRLTVCDCCRCAEDIATVHIICNDAPAANAGDDVSLTGLQQVVLDGSATQDLNENDILIYQWHFTQLPPTSELTDNDIHGYNTKYAKFNPDVLGLYEVNLLVSDCCSESASRKKIVVGCNDPPIASAGEDIKITGIYPFPVIDLDGCGSSDPDHDDLEYTWKITKRPKMSRLIENDLVNPDACLAMFTPDALGIFEFEISVSDHCANVKDTVTVIVGCNRLPQANAGMEQTVAFCCSAPRVDLDGSLSSDADGDSLEFNWKFFKTPEGSKLANGDIDHGDEKWSSFFPDTLGTYDIVLEVTDSCTTDADHVRINYVCNASPVASAGNDRKIEGSFPWVAPVVLDGSASYDPDSDEVKFTWSFVSIPDNSELSSAAIVNPHLSDASFTPDVEGRYELEVEVSDCCSFSSDRVIIHTTCGKIPTANAGWDRYLIQNCEDNVFVVDLDGNGSYDIDGQDLEYHWRFLNLPKGSTLSSADIQNADSIQASFVLKPEHRVTHSDEYVIELAVSDSCRTVYDQVKVTYCCNDRPTAHAGIDFAFAAAPPFPAVTLDGSESSDPNNDVLVYDWVFLAVPSDSGVTRESMDDPTIASPSFHPDVRGEYELQLTIRDCCSASSDRVKISVTCDNPPTAIAGENQVVDHKCGGSNLIVLDGTASFDPDMEQLSFLWEFTVLPVGSTLDASNIINPTSDTAKFQPDRVGDYELRLVVTDGCSVVSDRVQIIYRCEGVPTAVAGEEQIIVANPPFPAVHLSGLGSVDPSGELLGYNWEFSAQLPSGSKLDPDTAIQKNAPALLGAYFTPDSPGCYDLKLTVIGCCAENSMHTTVCVACNDPPVANAGKDQDFMKGAQDPTVYLDGSDSFDPDGDRLDFSWRLLRFPEGSRLGDAGNGLFKADTANPSLTLDATGVYEIELEVYDMCNHARDKVIVNYWCNHTPIPNAGPDRSIVKTCGRDTAVAVDGRGTMDADVDPLTVEWTFKQTPEASALTHTDIVDSNTLLPFFYPDEFGLYELLLTVSDYCFTVSDTVVITYHCNESPVAKAGTDQDITAFPYPMISVFGEESYDPNGDSIDYHWKFLQTPADSQVTAVLDEHQKHALFQPDVAGIYVLSLTVEDCCSSSSDEVKVTVNKKGCNNKPEAVTGEDQIVVKSCSGETTQVILDGSASSDVDGDALSFKWKLIRKPFGSLKQDSDIVNAFTKVASFVPDYPGEYSVVLEVNDGCNSAADELSILFNCNGSPVAYAGEDQEIDASSDHLSEVVIDGSAGTSDPESDMLMTKWTFVEKAHGSCLEESQLLSDPADPTGAKVRFQPDARGCYKLMFTASDCCSSSSDTVTVCLICQSKPIASAGEDISINSCPPYPHVQLAATDDSAGPKGDLSYNWYFDSKPGDSELTELDLKNANDARAFFKPDVAGDYRMAVVISNGCSKDTATVNVHVGCNSGPLAHAGNDVTVRWDGEKFPKVVLDGSASSDPDGDSISWHWKFSSTPNLSEHDIGTSAGIEGREDVKASFWPDVAGEYELELVVRDCCSMGRDKVKVQVGCNGPPTVCSGDDQLLKKSCNPVIATVEGYAEDPEGDELTYKWTFTNIPPGSKMDNAKISNLNQPMASFYPDISGSFFEMNLCVSDGCSTSCDRVKIEYECNDPPTANAGPDQRLTKTCDDQVVYLDGSASFDPDDDPLKYTWRFTNKPANSELTDGSLMRANTTNPYFKPDVIGIYEIELTVTDCCEIPALRCTCMKDRVWINLGCHGSPPVPDAGEPFIVNWQEKEWQTVKLSAQNSYDDDRDELSFAWTFIDVPRNSATELMDSNTELAWFNPDTSGVYTVEVCVSDCCYKRCTQNTVTVQCDQPPIVMAGPDMTLQRKCTECHEQACGGVGVFLDGTSSSDPEGDALTCEWKFLCSPTKSCLDDSMIQKSTETTAFFSADELGEYAVQLECFDGCTYVVDEVVINVECNDAPQAIARIDGETNVHIIQECGDREMVMLDGSASYDDNEDPLTYKWKFIATPDESELTDEHFLEHSDKSKSFFKPDRVGTYIVDLHVSDCCQSSVDRVTVQVTCSEEPVAVAGESKEVKWDGIETQEVDLDGSASTDPDSEILKFSWEMIESPAGSILSTADITHATSRHAKFVPDDFGCFKFQLTASDCCVSKVDFTSVCVVCSNATAANAGEDQVQPWQCGADMVLEVQFDGSSHQGVTYEWNLEQFNDDSVPTVSAGCDFDHAFGTTVHLDNVHAADRDGDDTIAFTWSFSEIPQGSFLTQRDLSARHNRHAFFDPDVPGVYHLLLTVTDGVTSAYDTIAVNVLPTTDPDSAGLAEEQSKLTTTSHGQWMAVAISMMGALALAVIGLVGAVVYYRRELHKAKELMSGSAGQNMNVSAASFRRSSSGNSKSTGVELMANTDDTQRIKV